MSRQGWEDLRDIERAHQKDQGRGRDATPTGRYKTFVTRLQSLALEPAEWAEYPKYYAETRTIVVLRGFQIRQDSRFAVTFTISGCDPVLETIKTRAGVVFRGEQLIVLKSRVFLHLHISANIPEFEHLMELIRRRLTA